MEIIPKKPIDKVGLWVYSSLHSNPTELVGNKKGDNAMKRSIVNNVMCMMMCGLEVVDKNTA